MTKEWNTLIEPNFAQDIGLDFAETLVPLKDIQYLAIHHTESQGMDALEAHRFHREARKWAGIGYNYFIEEDGAIIKGRGCYVGAHVYRYNRVSLGIALSGDFDSHYPTEAQMESARKLCLFFMKQCNLQSSQIIGHREFPDVSKSCPGRNFDMDGFRNWIEQTRLVNR
ncbi:peptidoglycan recognition protein family protein [Paenibacillus sp. YIM B09110]|uniref:peptidoglycan recognition protein family protein n=1 Tax=Paenibacillus sp. YIM B09110 TaxID=3126102 RepID=UPI00301DE1B3